MEHANFQLRENQNHTESAPGSLLEPGSWVGLFRSITLPSIFFRICTYITAESKGFSDPASPLESALTKKRGEGVGKFLLVLVWTNSPTLCNSLSLCLPL
jgi:hypothetical protein